MKFTGAELISIEYPTPEFVLKTLLLIEISAEPTCKSVLKIKKNMDIIRSYGFFFYLMVF